MRKVFEWLDNRRFPGDWAIADMVKQHLRGRRKQITKHDKVKREVEAENLKKERRRRQAILQKRTILDPEPPLAIDATNEDEELEDSENNPNRDWPPARPHKKRHTSPLEELSELSDLSN
jgi:hypothetical protein